MTRYKKYINKKLKKYVINKTLSKNESLRILKNECPFCRVFAGSGNEDAISSSQKICNENKKGNIIKCILRSNNSDAIWLQVTESRKKVEIGDVYGDLIVIEKDDSDKHGNLRWKCLCICGNIKTVFGYNLSGGATRSCGCKMGGDHCSKKFKKQTNYRKLILYDKKIKWNYTRGSAMNPDGTHHIYHEDPSSKLGCACDKLIEERNKKNNQIIRRYYVHHKCFCGGMVRFSYQGYSVCDKCGLVY